MPVTILKMLTQQLYGYSDRRRRKTNKYLKVRPKSVAVDDEQSVCSVAHSRISVTQLCMPTTAETTNPVVGNEQPIYPNSKLIIAFVFFFHK